MTENQEPLQNFSKTKSENSNNRISSDSYEQNGNLGAGHISGSQLDGTFAGTYNEASNNIRADKITIESVNISNDYTTQKTPQISLISSGCVFIPDLEEKYPNLLGKIVSEDHKYKGQLVSIELEFFGELGRVKDKNILIKLSIGFGQADEKFSCGFRKVHVQFGIKQGKLCLKFAKGEMPLGKRTELNNLENCQVTTTGIKEAPIWEFQAKDKQEILKGSHRNKALGIANLSENNNCLVEAVFKVIIVENDIVITSQSGLWNSKTESVKRETIMRAFLKKYLKPRLEDYLSKVEWEYDSTVIS